MTSERAWRPGDVVRYDGRKWGYYLDHDVVGSEVVLVVGRIYGWGGKRRARIERVNVSRLDEQGVSDE